jgi:glycosyltransferase involved in cell wall biosynthesis
VQYQSKDDSSSLVEQDERVGLEPPAEIAARSGSESSDAAAATLNGTDDALERLVDMHKRFPDSAVALRLRVRGMAKAGQLEDAADLVQKCIPNDLTNFRVSLRKAELLHDARAYSQSDEVFEALIKVFPDSLQGRIAYAKCLKRRGILRRAVEVVAPIASTSDLDRSSAELVASIRSALGTIELLCPGQLTDSGNAPELALEQVILRYTDRPLLPQSGDQRNSVALITGGLGCGGAERQMTRLAVHLERSRRNTRNVGRDRPVEVIVRSWNQREGQDFFLPDLLEERVAVRVIEDMPPSHTSDLDITDPVVASLIECLPQQALYGAKRLVSHFRQAQTDIAFIWQDGAVLLSVVAALIAGVRRIVLSIRGMPPSLRAHLAKPEYERMYRALGRVPGVQFLSNSRATARAYCDWLDLPESAFIVVPNGVETPTLVHTAEDEQCWHDFESRTPDATQTIGTVFRFDTDKRPLLWVRLARQYLKSNPTARFLLVGGGRLLEDARDLVEKYGIADRFLFTGRSVAVGYWLSKMDLFVLTSVHEGLPNVLIEAQLMGLPVVSTPAGGAGECFVSGETGILLSATDPLDFAEACESIAAIQGSDLRRLSERARSFARARFSVEGMVARMTAAMSCTSLEEAIR